MTIPVNQHLLTLLQDLRLDAAALHIDDAAAVLLQPLELARLHLVKAVQDAVPEHADDASAAIQLTATVEQGDFCVILPKLNHDRDAELWGLELMTKFPKSQWFLLPVPEGAQLRFFLEQRVLGGWLPPYIQRRGPLYGGRAAAPGHTGSDPKRKRVLIESSSPNIASEFHGKHLRSTILGHQLAQLYRALDWDVVSLNYLGDWGKPIGLLGAGYERYGSQELLDADALNHLHQVYQTTLKAFLPEQAASRKARDERGDAAAAEVEASGLFAERNAFFKRMQAGDSKALEFANTFRSLSIEQYSVLYARLGVSFDEYSGESRIAPDTMAEVLRMLDERQLLEDNGGARCVNLKSHGSKHGMAVIVDRDGSNTYLLRDIAAVLERHRKFSFDKMLYVVAADSNKVHFLKVLKLLELMGLKYVADKLQHVSFNEATNIPRHEDHDQTLAHVLDSCETALQEAIDNDPEKGTQLGGVSMSELCRATMFAHVANVRSSVSMSFDRKTLALLKAPSGADYLAWYKSLGTIIEDIDQQPLQMTTESDAQLNEESGVPSTETDSAEAENRAEARSTLLRLLARYPEAVDAAFNSAEPAIIMTFVTSMVTYLGICLPNRSRNDLEMDSVKQLLEASRTVLGNALKLLGVLARDSSRDSGVFV